MTKLFRTFAAVAALALATSAASAASLVVEYDYHNVQRSPVQLHYVAVGVTQDTGYGVVDAYWQGQRVVSTDGYRDNNSGYEVGYGYNLSVVDQPVFVRAAVGNFSNIDQAGSNKALNYALLSAETSFPLKQNVSGYVGYSHTFALNSADPQNMNRVQAGVDFTLPTKDVLRTGVSAIKAGADNTYGVVFVLTHPF